MACWSQFAAYGTMIQFIFLILLFFCEFILSVKIQVDERNADLNTVNGARAELVCEVKDIRDPLR